LSPAIVVPVNVALVRFDSTCVRQSTCARRSSARGWALMLAAVVGLAGCGRGSGPPRESPVEEMESTLAPAGIAKALRKAGGGVYHAVTTFDIGPQAGADRDAVTTTTDIWVDKAGHYRLLETNSRDGGREVIAHGRDLAVALRYGRLIKRPLQEAEAARYLEEGLGGPSAAWEIARRFAELARKDEGSGSARKTTIEVTKANEPQSVKADIETASPLQKWRESVNVDSLTGQVHIDGSTLLPMKIKLEARFGLSREGTPMTGLVRVDAEVRDVAHVAPLEPPNAEELQVRQRTILEERALLGRATGEPPHK
jgi:hypothetical protein